MCSREQVQPKLITREGWLYILSRHVSPQSEPHIKRTSQRHDVESGLARLVYQSDGTLHDYTLSLLQISADGLTVRNHKPIRVGTPVQVEVMLDDDSVALTGRVMHCTETIGAYKLGVRLQFPE
jgi:hypothetical protein